MVLKGKLKLNIFCSAVLLVLLFSQCSSKQQYQTILNITDTVVTQAGLDTMQTVLIQRLELSGIKNAIVKTDIATKKITITSKLLDDKIINSVLIKRGTLEFYECYNSTEVLSLKMNAELQAELFTLMQVAQPYTDGSITKYPGNIGYCYSKDKESLTHFFKLYKDLFPSNSKLFFMENEFQDNKKQRKIAEVYLLKNDDTKLFIGNKVKMQKQIFVKETVLKYLCSWIMLQPFFGVK